MFNRVSKTVIYNTEKNKPDLLDLRTGCKKKGIWLNNEYFREELGREIFQNLPMLRKTFYFKPNTIF